MAGDQEERRRRPCSISSMWTLYDGTSEKKKIGTSERVVEAPELSGATYGNHIVLETIDVTSEKRIPREGCILRMQKMQEKLNVFVG